tara:strand:- start:1127 stop:1318 length:192 start_codon:yes stop_codon:yes gene_type:complete
MIDRILLLLLGICIVLMSIVTLADPDGYYMQSIEGIFFTLIIGSLGLTMVLLALSKMVFNKTE